MTTTGSTCPTPRIDPTCSVNEVLRRHPATAAVFNSFGVDACCGGASSLTDAALRDGADPDALYAALEAAVAGEAK